LNCEASDGNKLFERFVQSIHFEFFCDLASRQPYTACNSFKQGGKMIFSKENVLDFGEQNVCPDIFLFARCKTFFLDLPTTPYSALYVRGPTNNEIFV
jgi:hypothetical protein